MESASSSLNPYAATYIPISRRGEDHATNSFENKRLLKDLESHEVPMSDKVASPSRSGHSADLTFKHSLGEEFQMNLEYLQVMFPGFSYQSLAAVYLESKEDMLASIEMLSQLESFIDETLENHLPDTLHIGYTADGLADVKLKNVKDVPVVALASSSGNSNSII